MVSSWTAVHRPLSNRSTDDAGAETERKTLKYYILNYHTNNHTLRVKRMSHVTDNVPSQEDEATLPISCTRKG